MRTQKLLTKVIERATPALYGTEYVETKDKIVTAKYFALGTGWTWFMVELNPETGEAFGYVDGEHGEWGYFNLNELAALRYDEMGGIPRVERDKWWTPKTFAEACNRFEVRPGASFIIDPEPAA